MGARTACNLSATRSTSVLRVPPTRGYAWPWRRVSSWNNNDTGFSPDAFAVLMQRAQVGDAAVYAPHIVYLRDPAMTWYGGGHFSSSWGFRADLEGEGQSNWAAARTERWTQFAPGCCKLVSTKLAAGCGRLRRRFLRVLGRCRPLLAPVVAGIQYRFLASPVIRHDAAP